MAGTIVLLGISHKFEECPDDNFIMKGQLMNPFCYAKFKEIVVPHVTGKTIIFLEGCFGNTLTPADPDYGIYSLHLDPEISLTKALPAFGRADPRFKDMREESAKLHVADARLIMEFFYKNIDLAAMAQGEWPRTKAEYDAVIKRGFLKNNSMERPSEEILGASRRVLKEEKDFNAEHIQQMTEAAKEYDLVLLLSGSAHTVSLHIETGWKAKLLCMEEDGSSMKSYLPYFILSLLPELICEMFP